MTAISDQLDDSLDLRRIRGGSLRVFDAAVAAGLVLLHVFVHALFERDRR